MSSRVVTVVAPYAEPLSTAEAKSHARVDYDDEDSLIAEYVRTAREQLQHDCSRSPVVETRRFEFDAFPSGGCPIELRWAPIVSVSSVTYYDTANALQTWSTADYVTDLNSIPARILPVFGETYPLTYDRPHAVRVTAVCGHATPFTVDATTNVLTWKGRTPTDDEVVRLTNSGGTLPTGLSSATDYYVRDASGSTCKLALTSGGTAIDVTGAGTGTHFIGEVPGTAMHALRMLVGHFVANREASIVGAISKETDFAYTALTERLMWSRYG